MIANDLIGFPAEFINNSKLHFATGAKNRYEPLYAFYKNEFQDWQNSQNNKNFELEYIFSLIYYAKHEWLFAGVYKKTGLKKVGQKYYYSSELQDYGKELIGRLIIRYEKKFRASYPYMKNHINKLQLLEVLREPYTVEPFPGFDKICIRFDLLQSIIEQEEKTWETALSNVKGIYLITDTCNGRQYIGSGYGAESLWKRWSDYANTGHGGNKKLKEIISDKGFDYASNFQFAILETRNINTDKDVIIRREGYWKKVLLSREFGYNIN